MQARLRIVRGFVRFEGVGLGDHDDSRVGDGKASSAVVFEVHELFGFPTFSAVTDAQLALQFIFYKSTEVVTPGRYVPKEDEEEPK